MILGSIINHALGSDARASSSSTDLFSGLCAFFSPTCPVSTRAAWVHNGGTIARAEQVPQKIPIHVFFVVGSMPTSCESRLAALGIALHDHTYVWQSLAKKRLLSASSYRIYGELGADVIAISGSPWSATPIHTTTPPKKRSPSPTPRPPQLAKAAASPEAPLTNIDRAGNEGPATSHNSPRQENRETPTTASLGDAPMHVDEASEEPRKRGERSEPEEEVGATSPASEPQSNESVLGSDRASSRLALQSAEPERSPSIMLKYGKIASDELLSKSVQFQHPSTSSPDASYSSIFSALSVPPRSSEDATLRMPIKALFKVAPQVLPWIGGGGEHARMGMKELKPGVGGFVVARKGREKGDGDGCALRKKSKLEVE